jgi:hypothetical protein
MVRYYGWYSGRSMGEKNKAGLFRPGDVPAASAVTPEVTVLDVLEISPCACTIAALVVFEHNREPQGPPGPHGSPAGC